MGLTWGLGTPTLVTICGALPWSIGFTCTICRMHVLLALVLASVRIPTTTTHCGRVRKVRSSPGCYTYILLPLLFRNTILLQNSSLRVWVLPTAWLPRRRSAQLSCPLDAQRWHSDSSPLLMAVWTLAARMSCSQLYGAHVCVVVLATMVDNSAVLRVGTEECGQVWRHTSPCRRMRRAWVGKLFAAVARFRRTWTGSMHGIVGQLKTESGQLEGPV